MMLYIPRQLSCVVCTTLWLDSIARTEIMSRWLSRTYQSWAHNPLVKWCTDHSVYFQGSGRSWNRALSIQHQTSLVRRTNRFAIGSVPKRLRTLLRWSPYPVWISYDSSKPYSSSSLRGRSIIEPVDSSSKRPRGLVYLCRGSQATIVSSTAANPGEWYRYFLQLSALCAFPPKPRPRKQGPRNTASTQAISGTHTDAKMMAMAVPVGNTSPWWITHLKRPSSTDLKKKLGHWAISYDSRLAFH